MKKILQYLKSPRSDIFLFVLVLVLANLVSSRSYSRLDLTSQKSYSLSKASRQVVRTLENPLSVKVFFSDNLNAPYASVYQYIKDILSEYNENGNRKFSYEFFDMNKPENEKIARDYGLRQIQIQEIKNNEVGLKQVWMGLAVTYADRIEIIDGIASTEGLEYSLTTTISRMIATSATLAGLRDTVTLTLYRTPKMAEFKIIGFDQVEEEIRSAFGAVNKKNMNRMKFEIVEPSENDIEELSEEYGIQKFTWDGRNSGVEAGKGIFGLVLTYKDKFNVLPLEITRDFFGRNMIAGLDDVESSISDGLQSLVSKNVQVGYITGHGELSLSDEQYGSARLSAIISDRYSFKEINLKEENIPFGLSCIVINGPRSEFADEELYKIDQFVMKGGNLIVFPDAFEEKGSQMQYGMFNLPTYDTITTGIEKSLEKYGITVNKDCVYDEECFVNQNPNYGKLSYYFAPVIPTDRMNQKNVITKNLGRVIFLQNSSISTENAEKDKNLKVTVLARSSENSWKLDKDISLNPAFISVPSEKTGSEKLAVLVEGKFSSAFDSAPAQSAPAASQALASESHLAKSVQAGKILVVSSSKMTTAQVLDENGAQPPALFIRNAFDYMNGEEDLCAMRTKGLSLNTLYLKNAGAVLIAKYFNELGLVILIIVAGLLALVKIRAKKRLIRARYNPNDSRIDSKN